MKTHTFNAGWTEHLSARRSSTRCASSGRATRSRVSPTAPTPKRDRRRSGHDRPDDRPQQLQPARDDDQALAGGRHRHLGARPAQVEGRLRLPVRRHPEPLPRLLQRRRTRSAASRRSPAGGRTAPTSCTSRTSPGRDDRARDEIRTSGSIRSSCRTSGGRADLTVNLGLRYDLMKTTRRRCGTPIRSLPRRTSTPAGSTPTPTTGARGSASPGPAERQVRRPRRLGLVLRPDAVDHARHRPFEQRHQHPLADVHRRRRCRPIPDSSSRFRLAGRQRGRRSSISTGLRERAGCCRRTSRRVGVRTGHEPHGHVSVRRRERICRARSIAISARLVAHVHRRRHRRDRSRITSSAPIGRSRTSPASSPSSRRPNRATTA